MRYWFCGWLLVLAPLTAVQAQDRWFQIELSVFSNESLADRAEEHWQPRPGALTFPDSMQRLQNLLDILLIEAFIPSEPDDEPATAEEEGLADFLATEAAERANAILAVGPEPSSDGEGFKFFDFNRDAFLQLPANLSDFQQTNRAIERSADHRLLYHGLWRQPVRNSALAQPLYINGGERYGEQDELQGSITIRFNDDRTRVVIDSNLWLTEFSTLALENVTWQLPSPPASVAQRLPVQTDDDITYHPVAVYHMQQSRDMRSTEFHYLDHPALGIVITVEPYELPATPAQGFATDPIPDQ